MTAEPSTGIASIDRMLNAILPGDNIVWQVDDLRDYSSLAEAFAAEAQRAGHRLVYMRFGRHEPVLKDLSGVEVVQIDPSMGFDPFAQEVHNRISEFGREVFYIFDCLSGLVSDWQTDDSLANFFRVACPYLYELDTVTYFALMRGQHVDKTIARIRDTTQVLVDVFHHDGHVLLHPLKALDRYSPTMFLPHVYTDGECIPLFESGQAAELLSALHSHPLRSPGAAGSAPWDRLYRRVIELREEGQDLADMSGPEQTALRDDLLRMTFGSRPELVQIARRYIDLNDLLAVRDRLIGTGGIGGKAAGMILARKILSKPPGADEISLAERLEPHDSFYIGSDVFFGYLVDNGLFRMRLQHGKDMGAISGEYEEIQQQFLSGRFSGDIIEQFSRMLDYFGQAPIIVRSSSLLEDDVGNAFAGKYESVFCPNQGHLPDRLAAFVRAVQRVYASTLSPDALAYRRKHNLSESDEQMAILVQRVAGRAVGPYFMPVLAGVGFSTSPYVWNESLDPSQGLLRIVVGLGTRAVDRVGGDYPRTIFLSHPSMRPEAGASQVVKYSQHHVDVLDITGNQFTTVPLQDLMQYRDFRDHAHLLLSSLEGGHLADPVTRLSFPKDARAVATFNNLLSNTDFVPVLRAMLARLSEAYGRPVDTEFTVSLREGRRVRMNLLQCRGLALPGAVSGLEMPEGLPDSQVLFESRKCASAGMCRGITHIIYIDPVWYTTLPVEAKRRLGRMVGKLNHHPQLAESVLLMMGPGRWGSSNIELGVNVTYADISNTSALVEVARERGGQTPEVSFGTHFFQDLVEDGILYVPVYPDRAESRFNREFFLQGPNALEALLPEAADIAGSLRVIDVQECAGTTACLVTDPNRHRAVCCLESEHPRLP